MTATILDISALSLTAATSGTALELEPALNLSYYTVVIPYPRTGLPTRWHPTSPVGPLAVLTRGAFKTKAEAHQWAADHLEGTEYTVDFIEAPMWTCMDELVAA